MAALLATAFVAFAIIGRVLIQYYMTGNHGIRVADPKADRVAALAGVTFIAAFIVSLTVVGLDYYGFWRVQRLELDYVNEFACAIGLLGIVLVVVAQFQMGSAWRIGVDPSEVTTLVTRGLFSKSRNPIYFGLGLYWLGLSVLLPHPIIWIPAVFCWVSIECIVRRVEEPHLRKLHSHEFDAYVRNTKRYWVI